MRRRRRTATSGRCAAAAPSSRSAQVDEARREMERTLAALAPYVERGVPVIGLEPSCLLELPRRAAGADQERRSRRAGGQCAAVGGIPRPRAEGRPAQSAARAAAARRRCCTAIATRRPSTPWARSRACSSWCPGSPSKRSNRAAAAWPARFGYDADTIDVSLKMGELSLAAGGAQGAGRCADRRRRHLVPAPDPRRRRPRGAACRPRAGDERRGRGLTALPG